jgi:hypothetical protein
MQVKIDLVVPCDAIEDVLCSQYRLDEPVKLTNMEYDEMGELCAFTFEVDEDDLPKIDRNWDDDSFASDLMQDAI